MPSFPISLPSLVRDELALIGASQADLARSLKVEESTVSRIIKGGRCSPAMVLRLADHFGWSKERRQAVLEAVVRDGEVPPILDGPLSIKGRASSAPPPFGEDDE